MFYVKIPNPVTLTHPTTGKPLRTPRFDDEGNPLFDNKHQPLSDPAEPVTMVSFVRDSICNNQKIGKGPELISRIVRLEMAFSETNLVEGTEGKYAAVESKDYEVVMSIVNELTWQTPLIGRQYAPLVEGWTKALNDQDWKRSKVTLVQDA